MSGLNIVADGTPPPGWLEHWPAFLPEFDMSEVVGADYNPRFLSEEARERLRASIRDYGLVKPVIVNANQTMLAGHQRTEALKHLGINKAPAVVMQRMVGNADEVRFNLFHNNIEENGSAARVAPSPELEDGTRYVGYRWLDGEDTTVLGTGRAAARIAAVSNLVTQHGPWGSVLCDPVTGDVLLNSDYAVALQRLRLPLLVYYPSPEQADAIAETLAGEFGVYDVTKLSNTPYVQTKLQRYRLRFSGTGMASKGRSEDGDWRKGKTFRSTMWEDWAIPRITKDDRILDFGAGRMDYARQLNKDGFKVWCYEPYLVEVDEETRLAAETGTTKFNIAGIVRQIRQLEREVRKNGLLDFVVLDSVLNATTNEEYEKWVLNTCAALLRPGGTFITGTLGDTVLKSTDQAKSRRGETGGMNFVDSNGRGVMFDQGQLYVNKYHSPATLGLALSNYYSDVEVSGPGGQVYAVCTGQFLDPEATMQALDTEFNMIYPGGYKHGQHLRLLRTVAEAHGWDMDEVLPNPSGPATGTVDQTG